MFDNLNSAKKNANDQQEINLLPEELRSKEVKEKEHRGHSSLLKDVDFNQPKENVFSKKNTDLDVRRQSIIKKKNKTSTDGKISIWHSLLSLIKNKNKIKDSLTIVNDPQQTASPVKKLKSKNNTDNEILASPKTAVEKDKIIASVNSNKILQNTAGNSIFPDHASQNKKIEFNQADLVKEQEDLEVNLVIPQHENITQEKAFFWYSLTAIISLLLVFGAFLYFKSKNIFYASELDVLSSQQSMIDQKISTAENNIKEFGSLAVKFNYINQLFDNHIYWSKFFPELEYYTVPGVYYSNLSVSSDLKINLSGRGRNLRALAEELVALRQSPHFYEVTLENMRFDMPLEKEDIGEDPGSIEFSISFYLDGQLINKTIIADK